MSGEDFGRVPQPHFRDKRAPESQPCACGTDVTRAPFESVMAAVKRHNGTPAHARWWERVKGAWQ